MFRYLRVQFSIPSNKRIISIASIYRGTAYLVPSTWLADGTRNAAEKNPASQANLTGPWKED